MFRRLMNIVLSTLVGSMTAFSVASTTKTVQNAGPQREGTALPSGSMMMQMPLVVPLFIEDSEFTSELIMVNASLEQTYADVVLRDIAGSTNVQRRVALAPHSQVRVSMSEMLRKAGSGMTQGSVLIKPSADLRGMTVAAQLTMTFRNHDDFSYIDEEAAMPSMEGSQDLHGVVDAGESSPLLGIANLSENSQEITITCIHENAFNSTNNFEIPASGVALIRACTENSHTQVHTSVADRADKGHPHGTIGISLHTDGPPGSFAAFAINPHREQEAVTYTSVPFADPKMLRSSGVVFAGVPVGAVQLLANTGEYKPAISVVNFGFKAANVIVKFATSGVNDGVVNTIRTLAIGGNRSMTLYFGKLDSSSPLQNSFIVESDGSPGQVGAKLVSLNEAAGLRTQLLDKDEKQFENAGLHPWSLEQGSDSTLLLFNHSAETNEFNVRVAAGTTMWQRTYKLKSFQTMALSLRQLQLERVKDDKGQAMPLEIGSGQIDWMSMSGPNGTGRILISNAGIKMARSFSCGSYEDLCGVSISPTSNQTLVVPGSGVQFLANTTFCWEYSPGICGGGPSGYGYANITWYPSGPLTAQGCDGEPSCNITANYAGEGFVHFVASDSYGCSRGSDSTQVDAYTVPTDETTSATGNSEYDYTGDPDTHAISVFLQAVTNNYGDNFDGIVVRERDGAPADDECYFDGSSIDRTMGVGGTVNWTIGSVLQTDRVTYASIHNTWGPDANGPTDGFAEYYIQQGQTGCTVTVYQLMQAQFNGAWFNFSEPWNTLVTTIDYPVNNCRLEWSAGAAVCESRYY